MRDVAPHRACVSLLAGPQPVITLLSLSGVGAPAQCLQLIVERRVAVNGRPVVDADARADPLRDTLTVNGRPVALRACRYIMFHKPYRVLSCFTDPEGRATLADYVDVAGVYAAGRLDYDSEGLLLLSDDGWLLHRITHPRYEHPKTYLVQVERIPDEEALNALRRGVIAHGERTRPAEVELLVGKDEPQVPPRAVPIRYRANVPTAWLRVVLREGRKRQLRHMTAAVGYPTLRLIRIGIGPLALGDLAPGRWRDLTREELLALSAMLRHPRPAGAHHRPSAEGITRWSSSGRRRRKRP